MPDFFDAPSQSPDPARFLPLVRERAGRRHRRQVVSAGVSVIAVLAAGTASALALSGGGTGDRGVSQVATTPPTSTPSPSTAPTASSAPSPSVVPRTKSPAAPTTAPATTPVDTRVKAYGDCRHPTVEPVEIVEACADNGMGIEHIHWTTWTSTRATGVGTLWYNDCNPSCVNGKFHYVRNTIVTLTEPVPGAGGQLVFSRIFTDPEPPGYATGPFQGSPEPMATQPD